MELALDNIQVNSVHPEVIATSMLMNEDAKEQIAQITNFIPVAHVAQPEEVSQLVVLLASDESSYSTGAEFVIDGSMTAR